MGFSASIYVYPRYKDVSYHDIKCCEVLLDYENSTWAQSRFTNAEEYAKEYVKDFSAQDEDVLNYYREHQITDEFNHKCLYKDYADWCSNGAGLIYDKITSMGSPVKSDNEALVILNKAEIIEIFNYFLEKSLEGQLHSCSVNYAYAYARDDCGEIQEDSDIRLIKCDGIEVEYEDGSLKRIDTNQDWDAYIGLPKNNFDEWGYSGFIEGLKGCAKILGEVDFENSLVIYAGGW